MLNVSHFTYMSYFNRNCSGSNESNEAIVALDLKIKKNSCLKVINSSLIYPGCEVLASLPVLLNALLNYFNRE